MFSFKGKVVVVGDMGVGKTALIARFIENKPPKDKGSSIGVAYSTKTITVDEKIQVKFDIWDTAGQERFRSINSMYYRGAGAAIIVYDITSAKSLQTAETFWVNELRKFGAQNIIISVVGNKCDLVSERQTDINEVQAWAQDNNLIYLETSARTGENINELFNSIARQIPAQIQKHTDEEQECGFQVCEVASRKRTTSSVLIDNIQREKEHFCTNSKC